MNMSPLRITIPGNPHPQGRGRIVRIRSKSGKDYPMIADPMKSRNWKATARQHMTAAVLEWPSWKREGPLTVEILAVFECPRSQHRKKTRTTRRWHTSRRGDVDNIAKAVLDAGNGVLWIDDAQVAELFVRKIVGMQDELPHVEVTVVRLSPM